MSIVKVTALIAAIAVVSALMLAAYQPQQNEYESFKTRFGFKFSGSENMMRKRVFEENLAKINHHNSLLGTTYKMGVNQFTAMTDEEFAQTYLTQIQQNAQVVELEDTNVGIDVDWVAYGAVSPVKDQGTGCNPTYAFSAVGAVEGFGYIAYKSAVEYSVQQVVDCSSGYGNNGCQGGRMDNTFNYIKDRGINTWASYPYVGYLQSCKTATGIFRVGGYGNVTSCTTLSNVLLNQPVSVAVDANNWKSYSFGVFSNCGTNLSLAALLVGMTDAYWKVKNSWGVSWGEAGYIRLSRGNTCGICNQASYPTK